jgi:Tfp pilus assembly protein PilV
MTITLRALMRDQRGVALPLALIALLILTMLVLTVLNLGAVEPQISRNLSDTSRARQLAEAGIEWAFECIADQDMSVFLAGPDGVQGNSDDQLATAVAGQNVAARLDNTFCVNSPAPGALPGLTTTAGTFAVSIRNDSLAAAGPYAGDQVLTGQAVDGGGKYVDTNGLVVVVATGTYGNATRQITAVVSRNTLAINAAVTLPGLQADTYVNGVTANQTIDGRDWTRTDTNGVAPTGTGPMRFGIVTQPGIQANLGVTYESRSESAFDTAEKQNTVQGKHQSSGVVTSGLNTIAPDSTLSPSIMQTFLNKLVANPATTVIQSSLTCPLVLTGTVGTASTPLLSTGGSGCPGNPPVGQTLNLGTPADPKLVYFRGQLDTSSTFTGLNLLGTIKGAGILVIEDGDLSINTSGAGLNISGRNVDFYWDGIVIVTGRYVGTGFRASSNTEIRGAFIANETVGTEANGYFEFLTQANSLALRNSTQNINTALRAAYNQRILSWREN